jgi:hypothetical protein
MEVYAQRFDGPGGKWQISTDGGSQPVWGPDGSELFYLGSDRNLTRVEIEADETLKVGLPEPLFESLAHPAIVRNHYLSDDGERFLVLRSMSRETIFPTTVVLNWDTTLRY